jgi:tetratricopeptide (TPR) repeat protein
MKPRHACRDGGTVGDRPQHLDGDRPQRCTAGDRPKRFRSAGDRPQRFDRPQLLRCVPAIACLIVGMFAACLARPAAGQPRMAFGNGMAPTVQYHQSFNDFYDGDYHLALARFQQDARSAVKTSQGRWIDSICYETMQGECHFHMGQYPEALTHYTAALELYQTFPTWLSQVRIETIQANLNVQKKPPWQTRNLLAPLGKLPDKMYIVQGQVMVPGQQIQQGGPLNPANMFPIEAREIVRCTALAIHRRGELLGPRAAHDPMLDSIIANLQRRPGQNQWADSWFSLELGMALSAGGRTAAAIPELQKATLASGEFEHPLTAMAHLELGRIAMAANDFPSAANHYEEASYASFYYPDINGVPDLGVMEEAFRYGAVNRLLANGKGDFPRLAVALAWAKATHCRQLYASLTTMVAEDELVLGHTPQAMALLDEARIAMGNKSMSVGRLGFRRMFLAATALYQAGKPTDGDVILAKVMHFMQSGSLWLFHMQQVDDYYLGGGNGAVAAARQALDLYPIVLRDPLPSDWLNDPMESLTAMWAPHEVYFRHWFQAAVARKDQELAVEVADRARRHRFLHTLPFGGRLESLRWVLEGPKDLLPQPALIQRQDLLTRYPAYKDLLGRAETKRRDISAAPLVPLDPEKTRLQGLAMTDLMKIGRKQEVILREMALRRDPAAVAFPPVKSTRDIQRSLPPGHALLDFYIADTDMYAFLLTRDKYAFWKVAATPQVLARQSAEMLRSLGNVSANYELTPKDLADVKWRKPAKDLLDTLLKRSSADFSTKFDELIVVPDGFLWYVPFEALQVQADGQLSPLISRFRIRYAPTAALAMATADSERRHGNTAIELGRLHPKMDVAALDGVVKDLEKSLTGCVELKTPLPAPGPIFASFIDRLVVFDELSPVAETDPYGWAPLPTERTKTAGPLADWFLLPRRGPDEVVLPGYHTAAESAPRKADARRGGKGAVDVIGPGNEIFLSLCGMMATGTRTVLISRWRTGGQSSLDLVKEFTQELPHTTPADAWQRAVQVVSNSTLNVECEPRIKQDGNIPSTTLAAHPFFWAGYLLADCGSPLRPAELKVGAK